ncbi:MAG: response regulator [Ignavibacteriaceae bacterium]|nr:response regulator [Ignavibacteria bacterium]MBT8390910.1 response regulator [Ignavibacteria bacterium]NNJ52683.1 response regulator [Ignavibacteriaceae bacterium]
MKNFILHIEKQKSALNQFDYSSDYFQSKFIKIIIYCSIILNSYVVSFSQIDDLKFSHLTAKDGLASNSVFGIVQDSKGFIWIGTYDGLCRYDGYNLKIFKNLESDSASLSENKIWTLCVDSSDNIWIGTWSGGLNKYNSLTEKFTRYINENNDPQSISSNAVRTIYFDSPNFLWIGTLGGGLNKFDIENNIFHHFRHNPHNPSSISDDDVYSIIEGQDGKLWIGTGGYLNSLDRVSNTFQSFTLNAAANESANDERIFSLFEDRAGTIWIGTTGDGVFQFDTKTNKVLQNLNVANKFICSDYIWKIAADSEGFIWIGTEDGGLGKFNPLTKTFNCFARNSKDINGINDNTICTIYEDRSGILWFGTWNGGINRLNKFEKKFKTYSHDSSLPGSLSSNSVYAIFVDSHGDLWVSTDLYGLNRMRMGTNQFEHYFHNPKDPNSISSSTIYTICEDKQKNLWLGGEGGLSLFNRKSNVFKNFKHDPKDSTTICKNRISQIFCDSRGNLWIGVAGGGLDKISNEQKGVTHFQHNSNNPKSISKELIFDFCEDENGNLWIGTWGDGLIMMDKQKNEFIYFRNEPNTYNSLSHNEVSVIHEDKSGILWIGTNDGLNRFDVDKKIFKKYTVENGLSSNTICGILEDNRGNLWISSYKGLSLFNIKDESVRIFGTEDGLQGIEFNNWAYFKDKNGYMYFGGTDGLNVFHPDSIKDNKNLPQIAVTNFQLLHKPVSVGFDPLWNRTILDKSISETEIIELDHDDNIISFEFAALDFRNPLKNKYAYLMEGFEEEWTSTDGTMRYVTYTNLNPGEYIFRVKGSNNDGIWNDVGTSIRLLINPPWWATWWAYALYGVIFIIIVISVREYDLKRQRLKNELELEHKHAEKLEEIDHMKSRFFANISHEFRTPLTLILGPAEKVLSTCKDENSIKQAGLIKKNAGRLLDLINQLLDLSKLESGKLKLQALKANISSFVKGIAMSFESIAESKDITLKINLGKENIEVYFDKDKMHKIITNIISNAFKFTPDGGKISIKLIESENNSVIVKVRDNGIGINKNDLPKLFDRFYQADTSHTREHEGTGIGLALTKELVELHKGTININSEEGDWTEVLIELPLGKNHLSVDEIVENFEVEKSPEDVLDDEYLTDTAEELTEEQLESDKNFVLVVEDNADVREYIKESISDEHLVFEAVNGEQGIRKAEKFIPDLIISDIMMPKIDGIELLKTIKNDAKTSHIPVILLTAKSEQADKLEGLSIGADAYLTKPFDINELQVRIKSLIEQRRKLQIKFSSGEFVPAREEKKLNKLDAQFMQKLMGIIDLHIAEEEFSIDQFGREAGMSRSQIHRKLKALTGRSPSQYLRLVRLSKAKNLIEEQKGTVSEISYAVGYSSPAYFSRCFKSEFGYPPSDLVS